MIVGSVLPSGDAIAPLRIRSAAGPESELQAVVDTGFNDWLTLSPELVSRLGLDFREEARYTLAGGLEAVARIFTAEVEWMGSWRRILVAELDGDPLLGMAMLRGCFLGIEVVDGGRVEIRSMANTQPSEARR